MANPHILPGPPVTIGAGTGAAAVRRETCRYARLLADAGATAVGAVVCGYESLSNVSVGAKGALKVDRARARAIQCRRFIMSSFSFSFVAFGFFSPVGAGKKMARC